MSPQEARRRERTGRIRRWIALAILIHAELLAILGVLAYAFAPRQADLEANGLGSSIEIQSVDDDTARRIVADLERQQEEAQKEEIKKQEDSVNAPGQVVEIPKPQQEQRPDKARYAAEYDSTVKRETKRYGKWDEKAQAGDARGADARTREASPAQQAQTARPGLLAMRTPSERPAAATAATPGQKGPELPESPDGIAEQGGGRPSQRPGGPAPALPSLPALMPSDQQLARAIGGGTQDALQDVEDGDETALNSKKWKFATFFNRVKRQVQESWHPEDEYSRRDPTGSIYGQQNRLTVLRIQLKPDGSLANVIIEQQCGVEFLDDEAIQAFRKAQPFPNPPRQLVDDKTGLISFRFGFLFEMNDGVPHIRRMFRYNSM